MTTPPSFVLHSEAAQDISDICEFIAADNPSAARRVREEILGAIRQLVPFPLQGHSRPDLTSRPLRVRSLRDYLIVYAPDEKPLLVIAVVHGRRNPRIIAATLRERG
jgi:antitoxin ParD1/3/4/toxin ParE1/3/4